MAYDEKNKRKICCYKTRPLNVFEGSTLTVERTLPRGGVDVLDEPVYWLFPSGELRCCTARALQRAGPAAGKTSRLVASQLAD